MNIRRIARFVFVGVINTIVYYAFYLLFKTVFPYLVAHIIAFVIAMIVSYFLNCYITFHTKPAWRTFFLFPLSNVVNFVVTTVGLRIAVGTLHMNSTVSPLIVALSAVPVTYVVAHYVMVGRLRELASDQPDDGAQAVSDVEQASESGHSATRSTTCNGAPNVLP